MILAGMYSKRSLLSQPISHLAWPPSGPTFSCGPQPLVDCPRGFGQGLTPPPRLRRAVLDRHQDLLHRRRFGWWRKQREQHLFFGQALIHAALGGRAVELLLQLRHAPEGLLELVEERSDDPTGLFH